jgi:SPW repeat
MNRHAFRRFSPRGEPHCRESVMTSATHPPQFQPAQAHRIKFATGVNFVAGAYMLIASFVAAHTAAGRINGSGLGVVVMVISSLVYGDAIRPRANWVSALIGAWFIASPWILRYADSQPWTLNSIVVGAIILVSSVGSGAASRGH